MVLFEVISAINVMIVVVITLMTAARGKPPVMKALAILLYSMGNASFGMIGRLLGVSHVTVYKWIKQEALSLPQEYQLPRETDIIQIDEVWHFVNGKKHLLALESL